MKHFAMLLVVLGVCIGALGSSGFHTPLEEGLTREEYALPLFVFGMTALCLGGGMVRWLRSEAARTGDIASDLKVFSDRIHNLQGSLIDLLEHGERLDAQELRKVLGELLEGDFFELTSKSDDLIEILGFTEYARIWEGVAVAERLLARAWSMCADGHREEGFAELVLALKSIERAARTIQAAA